MFNSPEDLNNASGHNGAEPDYLAQQIANGHVTVEQNEKGMIDFVVTPSKPDFNTPLEGFPHVTESGRKRGTLANIRYLLAGYGIDVSYDEMLKKQVIKFNNEADKSHSDLSENAGIAHIKSLLALNGVPGTAIDLMPALFSERAINPVLDWIEGKPWDKRDRMRKFADTLVVAEDDRRYRDLSLNTWMLQCVAAADGARRTPNKDALPKYELVLALQGGQGAMKTSWFRLLVNANLKPYIVDGAHLDPADKDTVRPCISSWICELGELDSTFRKTDISRLKAFLSKQTDTIRLPYDRAESTFGRRTSFCGSVNPKEFLSDSTGARRFLPVQILDCNSRHTIDMQQVWAQVWTHYLEGQQWWCGPELEKLLVERHQRHTESSPVEDLLAEYFLLDEPEKDLNHRHMTPTRILIECGIKEPKQAQATIAKAALEKKGFKYVQNEGVRGYWIAARPRPYNRENY